MASVTVGTQGQDQTYPFSPFRMPFTTSLTPRFTCLCLDAESRSASMFSKHERLRTLLDGLVQLLQQLLLCQRMRYG